MKIWKSIIRLNIRQLFQLSGIIIMRPRYILPTFRATRKTMKICDALYGNLHYKNTAANAFRHAFWNVLICLKTISLSKEPKSALAWAKKITDMHEKLIVNKHLETAMDIHNNAVGRNLFKENPTLSEDEFIYILKEKEEMAKKVEAISEIEFLKGELVFIE